MRISVYQHIYSNVPKEQSPTKRRGYQTLFYTQDGLTREEVLILEDRAQYYGEEIEPVKHQFHMLPQGKAVVSQIVPLAELDEFGRKGRYLSHSLVISPTDFQTLEYVPLDLFLHRSFITDLPTVLSQGDQRTGNIPALTLNVADNWQDVAIDAARDWAPRELEKLARLGWQASKLREERKSVITQGDGKAFFKMLAVVFLLTAPEKRSLLTFDTYAKGCDWTRDWPFWIWGGLSSGDRQDTFYIDAQMRKVHASLSNQYDSPYEQWVVHRAIPQKLEYLLAYQETAWRLEAFLNGKNVDLTTVPPQFGAEFTQMNVPIIISRVLSYFPQELSTSAKQQIASDVQTEPWPYMERLGQGFTRLDVAEVLYDLQLRQLRTPLAGEERKALEQIARETKHLELLSVLKLRGGDLKGWQDKLPQLSADSYGVMVDHAMSAQLVSASESFCPDHFATWSNIASRRLRPGDLKAILKQLKAYKNTFDADQLIYLLPGLSQTDQQLLIDWASSYNGPAPRLRAALNISETTSTSFTEKVRKLFAGKKGN